MKTETPAAPAPAPPASPATAASVAQTRLPLRGWSLDLARRWNGGTYSLFILHGNIFDLFPVQQSTNPLIQQSINPPAPPSIDYVPLKTFLVRRLFPERACMLFYDIADGLT